MTGLPVTDAVWAAYGNADSARAWLTARDARMKAEGAAEAMQACAVNARALHTSFTAEWFEKEAAKLRESAK